ncbi:hypothetical protein [Rhizobium rhizogenes]|uniref:hypothetical protein n=1 Tax=Rhizobium rhizogenes TaxID=359 RepID=UPI00226E8FEB|nr:hypothetical protein [Rhizobium rhizogenes]
MNTLLLDVELWDLAVDTAGNIAMASDPYSMAQDAASAIKTFAGEVFYDTTLGIPYFTQILGLAPPIGLMKANFNEAALTVPGVETSACFITSWDNRIVRGQVQITDSSGTTSAAGF